MVGLTEGEVKTGNLAACPARTNLWNSPWGASNVRIPRVITRTETLSIVLILVQDAFEDGAIWCKVLLGEQVGWVKETWLEEAT
jgi:hypothetical protein